MLRVTTVQWSSFEEITGKPTFGWVESTFAAVTNPGSEAKENKQDLNPSEEQYVDISTEAT